MKRLALLMVWACLAGCNTPPAPLQLARDGFPENLEITKEPYACNITVAEVIDARPTGEVLEADHYELRYLVPLFLYNQWSGAGPTYMDRTLYATQGVAQGTSALIQRVLDESGAFSGKGKEYDLHVRINHLYGVSYTKDFWIIGFGGAGLEAYDFFPCGHVELAVTLKDKQTGAVLGEQTLTRSFLFNPEQPGLSCALAPGTVRLLYEDENIQGVVKFAVREVMKDLVKTLDRMVASDGHGADVTTPPATFRVIRLTDEYDFCEEMRVEYATGSILTNAVRKYNAPIVSRPGEWIVLPEGENGHWLAPAQYRKTVELLSAKYKVGFADNLDAAYFKGLKD